MLKKYNSGQGGCHRWHLSSLATRARGRSVGAFPVDSKESGPSLEGRNVTKDILGPSHHCTRLVTFSGRSWVCLCWLPCLSLKPQNAGTEQKDEHKPSNSIHPNPLRPSPSSLRQIDEGVRTTTSVSRTVGSHSNKSEQLPKQWEERQCPIITMNGPWRGDVFLATTGEMFEFAGECER